MSEEPAPYCICGQEVVQGQTHRGCIESGILRKMFNDTQGWIEYCLENGKRIAPYYAIKNYLFPEQDIVKNK